MSMIRALPALSILSLGLTGCAWVPLAYNALTYPTTQDGEAGNVVARGRYAYVTLGGRGLAVIDLSTGETLRTVPPAPGAESVDDVAAADGLLFALDARIPGHLSVYSLKDPSAPAALSGSVEAPVGPFSGVSAGAGRVIVSGGTSLLTLRSYDRTGRLGEEVATIDLGRGQPDVLLAPDGSRAFVSTHYVGPRFGLVAVSVDSPPRLAQGGSLELDGAGFTAGGAKPANFPMDTALSGDVLLLAHSRGLAFIDVKDLAEPKLLTVLKLGLKAVNVDAQGGVAAVVGSSPKPLLVLVDIRDPRSPAVLRSIPLPEGSHATSVAIGGDRVVVATHKRGALIFPR